MSNPSTAETTSTGTTIAFTFPLGRYHATALGTAPNDGVVEWPPSPWRLLRALYSSWRTRNPDLPATTVEPLLAELAAVPEYHLDTRTSIGQTRHYMPGEKSGIESSALVHDTFVVCSSEHPTLFVAWPALDLSDEHRSALGQLCDSLTWLGRAESIVDAHLLDRDEPRPETNCRQLTAAAPTNPGTPIRLLVPDRPLDIKALTVNLQEMRGNAKTRATLPAKAELHAFSRPNPDAVHRVPVSSARRHAPTAVRLAVVPIESLDTPDAETVGRVRGREVRAVESSRSAARLPLPDVLVHASALRRAAMSLYGRLNNGSGSPTLSGRADDGPRRGHSHAHYLPLPADGLGRSGRFIESFLIWAPEGLNDEVLDALQRLRRVDAWQWVSASRPFRVVVDGIGEPADLAPGLVATGGVERVWTSLTPVVPGHHPHHGRSWEDQVVKELQRDLSDRGLSHAEISLERWAGQFGTARPRSGRPSHRAQNARFAVSLTFDEPPVSAGPICLGAQSHFGLGLFRPTA